MLLLIQSEAVIVLTDRPLPDAFQPVALTLYSKATWAWAPGHWAGQGRPLVCCGAGQCSCVAWGSCYAMEGPSPDHSPERDFTLLKPKTASDRGGRWFLTWGPFQ